MLYHTLHTDRLMPMLGLGTYDLRGDAGARLVSTAIELGYRHVDTSANYDNEEAVGRGIKDSGADRAEIFLTTKVDRERLGRAELARSCEESLARLGVDYVDLLLIHWPNKEIPLGESFAAMEALVAAGKVRHIGVSNFIRPRLAEAVAASRLPIAVNQVEFHPWLNQRRLLSLCREKGSLLTAYSPLAQGAVLRDETLVGLAEDLGRSVAQVCLRWLLQQGVAAIPKSATPERMRENLGALDFELGEEEMERIDRIQTRKRVIDWWPGEFDLDPES